MVLEVHKEEQDLMVPKDIKVFKDIEVIKEDKE
jgi:hypothetical protein